MLPEPSKGDLLVRSQLAGLAFPALISPQRTGSVQSFAALLQDCVADLPELGAILFRGFPVRSAADFDGFARLLTPELLDYDFGSTPRSRVNGRVYTSTEYPPHQIIPQHNEQSYTREWPLKLWFFCAQAPVEGGRTPLCDSREVLRRLPATVRERLIQKQIMYVRNYGNGLDLPWQDVFQTSDRAAVERFCRRAGITCEWKADGELRTRQVCPAVVAHPVTGERVWFNQAHLFHVSNLEPDVRAGLLSFLAEDELPRNALYGDGSPIEHALLAEVREAYRELTISFAWREGDVLLVDNILIAHGREPYRGPRKVLVAMAERGRTPIS